MKQIDGGKSAFDALGSGMVADEEPKTPKYDPQAVQKEIEKDKRIGGKEAKAIHSLLKGWRG